MVCFQCRPKSAMLQLKGMTPAQNEELIRYINLKLVALGQPSSRGTTDPYFLEIVGPLLRNYYQKDQLLGNRLCPADTRIQQFLEAYLKDVCPGGAPHLPANQRQGKPEVEQQQPAEHQQQSWPRSQQRERTGLRGPPPCPLSLSTESNSRNQPWPSYLSNPPPMP